MLYLRNFRFASESDEIGFMRDIKETWFNTWYPFQLFTAKQLAQLDFEPITILCGGNGSGKTTALNVIAEKLHLKRNSLFNQTHFFKDYVSLCDCNDEDDYMEACRIPPQSRIITSDDVFQHFLTVRDMNYSIDSKRDLAFDEYNQNKHSTFTYRNLNDYEQLKKVNLCRRISRSEYSRRTVGENIREYSNGENALMYFTEHIEEQGLYLLDEPENSLSPENQLELVRFIEDSARFYKCQFIIATHSPFLLSIKGAKIYDLDAYPVVTKKWTELPNVQQYFTFFKEHEEEFEK